MGTGGAEANVGGEKARFREEVGDELDEDERLRELDRLGRGLVWGNRWAAVGDCGHLES